MEYYHELVTCNADLNCKLFCSVDHPGQISKHWHNSFEILYVLNGSLGVDLDNQCYLLRSGDFILIHPRRIHSTTCKYRNETIVLQIPYQLLQGNVPDLENILFSCVSSEVTAENMEAANRVRQLLKSLLSIDQKKADGYPLKINSLLFDLLFVLYRHFTIKGNRPQKENEKYLARLERITSYIRKNYKQDISLTAAAETVGLNPEYFSRFFKKYVGITYIEYLNTVRLEHCYNDIQNTGSSISEIIERNGFRNYRLFMKLFKKNYGCTPSQQRAGRPGRK
ncbi:MAG: AraC family transcriptional regulator [Clostridiales bacterium]|nr:AraC family transcriptional regulator [Clostridiales bacterium]